jgi:hypothetical protein
MPRSGMTTITQMAYACENVAPSLRCGMVTRLSNKIIALLQHEFHRLHIMHLMPRGSDPHKAGSESEGPREVELLSS